MDVTLILLVNILIFLQEAYPTRMCKRYSIEGGIRKELSYCCKNYKWNGDTCEECPIGYTSSTGLICTPCNTSNGFYGKRCTEICDCEKCNHITGCLETTTKHQTDTTEGQKVTTILPQTDISDENPTVGSIADSNTKYVVKEAGNGKTNVDDQQNDKSNKIVIYIACTGGLTLLVGICGIAMKHCDMKIINFNFTINQEQSHLQVVEIREEFDVLRNANIYNQINDEDVISNF